MIIKNTKYKQPSGYFKYIFLKSFSIVLFALFGPFLLLAILVGGLSGILLVLFLASLVYIFFILPAVYWDYLSYKSCSFIIQDNKIIIESGVLRKGYHSLLLNTIVNIDLESGFFMRRSNLVRVKFWSKSPNQMIMFNGNSHERPAAILYLTTEDAYQLRDLILG